MVVKWAIEVTYNDIIRTVLYLMSLSAGSLEQVILMKRLRSNKNVDSANYHF